MREGGKGRKEGRKEERKEGRKEGLERKCVDKATSLLMATHREKT